MSQNPNTGRARDEILADAIAVLTEAAGLTTDPVLRPREDFADFLATALAAAAANAGGVDSLLSGRPGSWEADALRQLLRGTVGADEQDLPARRTEPIRIWFDLDANLSDFTSGQWDTQWSTRLHEAEQVYAAAYDVAVRRHVDDPHVVDEQERHTLDWTLGAETPWTDAQQATYERLRAESAWLHQVEPGLDDLQAAAAAALDQRTEAEGAYVRALVATATAEARRLGYTVDVVAVDVAASDPDCELTRHLEEVARMDTPVPPLPDGTRP